MDSIDIVTEKSISFLQSVFDSTKHDPKHAYPISMLPYPKEKMKEALRKYIVRLGQNRIDQSLQYSLRLCIVKSLYLSLADFRDTVDFDAAEKEREEMSAQVNSAVPVLCSINLLALA